MPQKSKQMRKLDLPTLCSFAALFDRAHGFSGNLPPRHQARNSCTICADGASGYALSAPLTPPPLDIRVQATWLYSSKEDVRCESSRSPTQSIINTVQSNPSRSIYFSLAMTLCGAVLGPFLDSYHSLLGVLTYDTPLVFPILGRIGGGTELLTCVTTYWVPPLFGAAGFLIGWLYILLDAEFYRNENVTNPSQSKLNPTVPNVFIGVSYFTFQYWISGMLFANHVDRESILIIMSGLGMGGYLALDRTLSGFITSAATAIGGPLIEVWLISALPESWAYHYNDPGETGYFPLWIIPVYFLGGPANGNLARAFWNALGNNNAESKEEDRELQRRVPCPQCQDTRAVKCQNCDDGTYISYGQQVTCKACRGKGRVICRACFGEYGDDPYDIENIRRIMDRIPD